MCSMRFIAKNNTVSVASVASRARLYLNVACGRLDVHTCTVHTPELTLITIIVFDGAVLLRQLQLHVPVWGQHH
jgi:hypothetical protein